MRRGGRGETSRWNNGGGRRRRLVPLCLSPLRPLPLKPREIVPSDSRLCSSLFFLFSFLFFVLLFFFLFFFPIFWPAFTFLCEQCASVRPSVCLCSSPLSLVIYIRVCIFFIVHARVRVYVGERTMEQDARGVALSHAEKRGNSVDGSFCTLPR